MAEVSNGQQDLAGIKLFGTTITLQNSKQVQSDDHHRRQAKKADGDVHDQTVEMKRPEKIIPCPRCKSTETKFCYFNNYNVNQPRHFCKGCQRYWTDGGALRNVPVGAGRRKTKPPGRDQVMTSSFPEGCMYEASEVVHQFELDGMVEQWHVAAVQGDYRHVFPVVKRRRSGSGGQTCS